MGATLGLELAKELRGVQDTVFDSFGVRFPHFAEKPITLKNVEHALCEFSKYSKIHGMLRKG